MWPLVMYSNYFEIKRHGCVSAAKKDVQHTGVLFTGTSKSPFSTSHKYNYWSNKFTYLCPPYTSFYIPNLDK